MISGNYIVIRPFKYDGKTLSRGEVWEPSGAKLDEQIIKGGRYVRFEPANSDQTPQTKRGGFSRRRNHATYPS